MEILQPMIPKGIEIAFKGEEAEEVAFVKSCNHPDFQVAENKVVMKIDKTYYRPAEVELLIGEPAKANKQLGWLPKYDLPAIVKEMVAADVNLFKKDKYLKEGGHEIINYHE